jgi:hypothetical protein
MYRFFPVSIMLLLFTVLSVVLTERPFKRTGICSNSAISGNEDWANHWVEKSVWAPGQGFYSYGPCIFRQTEMPTFVLQRTTIPTWGLDDNVPFLLVIEGVDSMRLLTDFSTEGFEFGVVSSGKFRAGPGCIGTFSHTFSQEEFKDLKLETIETVQWSSGNNSGTFNVANGRIFVAKIDKENKRFVFRQMSVDLPPKDLVRRLVGMEATSLISCQLLNSWWQKESIRSIKR